MERQAAAGLRNRDALCSRTLQDPALVLVGWADGGHCRVRTITVETAQGRRWSRADVVAVVTTAEGATLTSTACRRDMAKPVATEAL